MEVPSGYGTRSLFLGKPRRIGLGGSSRFLACARAKSTVRDNFYKADAGRRRIGAGTSSPPCCHSGGGSTRLRIGKNSGSPRSTANLCHRPNAESSDHLASRRPTDAGEPRSLRRRGRIDELISCRVVAVREGAMLAMTSILLGIFRETLHTVRSARRVVSPKEMPFREEDTRFVLPARKIYT